MNVQDRAALVFTVCAVGLVVAGILYNPEPPTPILAPATQKAADSLVATAPAFDDQMARSDSIAQARADSLELLRRRMAAQRRSSDSLARAADSLAAVAKTADDWKRAYEYRFLENVQLREELFTAGQRIELLVADTVRLSADKDTAIARVRAHEQVQAMISRDIAAANERMQCYVIRWPKKVRCPTRTQSAIGGAVAGGVAGIAAARN